MSSDLTCYCGDVRVVRSPIRFVILQHPLERKRTVGSARMAHLCLENSVLRVGAGEEFDSDPVVQALIRDPGNHCAVLYPGEGAENISVTRGEATPSATAKKREVFVVFVIDGTWSCAKSMLKRSATIRALPQISFNAVRRSEYRFRRQPDERCLSTLEAIHEVVSILAPEVDASILMALFRKMVQRQVSFQQPGQEPGPSREESRKISRSIPSAREGLSPALPTPPAT